MYKKLIEEIKEVFYERLTDDIFDRYEEYDTEEEEKNKDRVKELITKDIDDFAEIMKMLNETIPKEKWKKTAYKYIDR